MNHVITTYGGGELFNLVFNGIAALFKEDRTGIIMSLIRVGLMVGSVYMVTLMLFRQQLIEGMKWFLWVVVATNLIFLPKTTIFIHDPLSNTKSKVDNVPYALGAFAGFVSQMGKAITETFESVFTLPDYMPYHKTGTVFASALMSQVGKFRIVDPIFKGNMERFVNQCVVYDAMIGHKYTLTDLQNTPDIWKLVSTKASPVLGFLYKDEENPGTINTCKEGANKLSDLWTGEIKKATEIYGSRIQNRELTESAFFTNLMGSAKLLSEGLAIAESAQSILRQEMMINAVEEASNNKLSELKVPSNYAATKALLQQRSTYAIAGDIAARTLPLFKNVIEALSYSLFIFIVVLALLPNGYRILITYFGILVWTQLWAPLYAVLNLIMTLYGTRESMGHGFQKGLTLLNSSAIVNANADMTALAAWLSVSIPFISYGIIKQGAGAFVGLAEHLGSAMQSAASGTAAEIVSGNISLGNVNIGTQAYQNTSAFQHNTSPTYSASQFKSTGIDGTEKMTQGDGTQTFIDHGTSQLPVKEMASVNEGFEMQQRLSHAKNNANSKSVAASKQMESAYQQSANFLSHVGSDAFAGESYNKSLSTSDQKALQDFNNFTKDIKDSGHLTEAQALEVAIYAKAGVDVYGTGAGGSTNFGSTAARQKAIEDGKHIAKTKGYSGNLETVLSAAKSVSEGKNDTKGASLGEGAMSSFNEAQHMRQEEMIAHSQVDEISNAMTSSQNVGTQSQRDTTQLILEHIASQPVNSGPGGGEGEKIGADGAKAIMGRGGEEYMAYRSAFYAENPQFTPQKIDVPKEQAKLNAQYENASATLGSTNAIHQHHSKNIEAVHGEGKRANLNLNAPPPTVNREVSASIGGSPSTPNASLKEEIGERITQADAKLKDREKDLKDENNVLTKIVENSKAKTLGRAAFENFGKSSNNGAVSVAEDLGSGNPMPYDKTPPTSPLFKK